MEIEQRAEEILDFCVRYLCGCKPNKKSKKYKVMLKEIYFMINAN